MATTILTKRSNTATAVPLAADLTNSSSGSELAVNTADKRLFTKDSGGAVVELGTNPSTLVLPSGSVNGVAYLNGSKVVTSGSALTFDGTNLTATNGASIQGLTVGKGGGADQYNTALGVSALAANTTGGSQNVAVGWNALLTNTTGTNNTAVGMQSLKLTTTGSNNSAIGLRSLQANTTGAYNTGLGNEALYSNTTASNNTAVGYQAGYSNTTGTGNLVAGYQAGVNATTASYSVFLGRLANGAGAATSNYNTGVGNASLYSLTSGGSNSALGSGTMFNTTTGLNSVAIGDSALYTNTSGSYNVGIGVSALYSNTTGATNTAIGFRAGYSNTTGILNTFLGSDAGYFITTGSKNTIVGTYSGNGGGLDIRTASNYIVLSDGDGNPRGIFDSGGQFLVGAVTAASSSGTGFKVLNVVSGHWDPISVTSQNSASYSCWDIYSTATSSYRFYVTSTGVVNAVSTTITAISDQRLKENVRDIDTGLDAIMALQPRRFDWKDGKGQDKKNVAGFIAQEFENVFPECVGLSKAGADGIEYKNINHETLIPTLVKAIQEQQAIIESLKARLDAANL
jgi:hypothetical protein